MAANQTGFQLFQQSEGTAQQRKVLIKMVDSTDGFSEETGITFSSGDVKISKQGAAFANTVNLPSEVAFGSYVLELTSGELSALGSIEIRVTQAGSRNFYAYGMVIGFDVFDATPNVGIAQSVSGNIAGDITGDVTAFSAAAKTVIENAIWDALPSSHSTINTFGLRLAAFLPTDSDVNDGSPAPASFVTNLTEAVNGFWNGSVIVFIQGALIGQSRPISGYDGGAKKITVTPPFTSAPANGDNFVILSIAASDVLANTTTELAAVPGKEPNIRDLLAWLYQISRNKLVSATGIGKAEVYDDADAKIADADLTDDGSTFTREKFS